VQQQSTLLAQQHVLESLTSRSQRTDQYRGRHNNNGNHTRNLPKWIREKPTHPDETRDFNNRTWYYCSKCRKGTGTWNITHTTGGHITNYFQQRSPQQKRQTHSSGLRCTSSTDSQDSKHSRKRSSITFANQRKPSSFKRQAQSSNDSLSCTQMINSLKGTRASLLSCLQPPDSTPANPPYNNGQGMGNGN